MSQKLIVALIILVVVIVIKYLTAPAGDHYRETASTPQQQHKSSKSIIARKIAKKEYSLDSVDLGGKTLGYVRVRFEGDNAQIHVRVPNVADYTFAMNVIGYNNVGGDDVGVSGNRVADTGVDTDTHIEKEAFLSTHGTASGSFYPHTARYTGRGYKTISSIPSALHHELGCDRVNLNSTHLMLEGYDHRGGEGGMFISIEDGKLHMRSNLLGKVIMDIERKKSPHSHFILTEV
jgi:hypothetical protein